MKFKITAIFLFAAYSFLSGQSDLDREARIVKEKDEMNRQRNLLKVKEADKEGPREQKGNANGNDGDRKSEREERSLQKVKGGHLKRVLDMPFDNFKIYFVDELWKIYPGWATSQGYHNYDSILIIPNAESRSRELKFCSLIEDSLKHYAPDSLSVNNRIDYRLIENFIRGVRFEIKEFKSYAWNPSNYNVGGAISDIIYNQHAPLEEKLRALNKKLANIPQYFQAAEKNISQPTKEHTQLAINQNKGSFYLFDKVLVDSVNTSTLSATEKASLNANAVKARNALENYVSFLTKILPTTEGKGGRSFRIGKDLYAKKFDIDINSRYSVEEMYKKALDRKTFVQSEMYVTAQKLWAKYMGNAKMPDSKLTVVKIIIDTLSTKHCKREDLISTIEKQLPELTKFINAHQLIDLDSTQPLKVRKTPEYMAGVAGASINSPGPYDHNATTYYNVTPLDRYSEAEAESYLREYNDYVLPILNIHEAIPGHYTQGIYANRSASIIKSILGNGATIEGWACYVERMMIEEGFHDSPEMLLFYYKWNLREVCNFILDYNIHCNDWTEKQVSDLLVNEAFQQSTEAKEKYKRATLSQVQLTSYFTGLTEIYELREELKAKFEKNYSLKRFNEKFLSFGSAPVKEIHSIISRGKAER